MNRENSASPCRIGFTAALIGARLIQQSARCRGKSRLGPGMRASHPAAWRRNRVQRRLRPREYPPLAAAAGVRWSRCRPSGGMSPARTDPGTHQHVCRKEL